VVPDGGLVFIDPLGLGPGPRPGPEHTNGTYMGLSVNTAGTYTEQMWNGTTVETQKEHELKTKRTWCKFNWVGSDTAQIEHECYTYRANGTHMEHRWTNESYIEHR